MAVVAMLLVLSTSTPSSGSPSPRQPQAVRFGPARPTKALPSHAATKPAHDAVAIFRPPTAALAEDGFVLEYASDRKGAFGNQVFLHLYVGPVVRSPTGERLGRPTLWFNAAEVEGITDKVDADLYELIKVDRLIDPGAKRDIEEVEVKGRPGLLVRQDGGRSVVTTCGDWRVQISTGAPPAWLSDEALLEIADNAQVR